MKVNLEYKLKDAPESLTPQQLTYNLISYAVNHKYKEGLEGQMRRVWGRIQRKFEDAIDNKSDEIELETAEKDFISRAYSDVKFPATDARLLNILDVEVDKLKESEETK